MRSKFYTNAGELKPYAYSCGYVSERMNSATGTRVTLGMIDGNVYRVITDSPRDGIFHKYFRTLTAARRWWRRALTIG